jgi:hypothetical protein
MEFRTPAIMRSRHSCGPSEIAALMRPEEIHPEVVEKLDAIKKAFRL